MIDNYGYHPPWIPRLIDWSHLGLKYEAIDMAQHLGFSVLHGERKFQDAYREFLRNMREYPEWFRRINFEDIRLSFHIFAGRRLDGTKCISTGVEQKLKARSYLRNSENKGTSG